MRALILSLALALAVGGCLRSSTSLIEGANVRVIVTGALPGDPVRVLIAETELDLDAAADEATTFFLTLAPGSYRGSVRVGPGTLARCGAFELEVPERGAITRSVDVGLLELCEPLVDAGLPDVDLPDVDLPDVDLPDVDVPLPDAGLPDVDLEPLPDAGLPDAGLPDAGLPDAGLPDAGLPDAGPPERRLLELVERVVLLSCVLGALCEETTTVDEEGNITYVADLVTASELLSDGDHQAIVEEVFAADALFAGLDPDCPQPNPAGVLTEVFLERLVDNGGELVAESVEVTECPGAAARIRERLRFLRLLELNITLQLE